MMLGMLGVSLIRLVAFLNMSVNKTSHPSSAKWGMIFFLYISSSGSIGSNEVEADVPFLGLGVDSLG